MITAEKVQKRLIDSTGYENDLEIIEESLKESWNEAVESVAENAYTNSAGKESILKLKK